MRTFLALCFSVGMTRRIAEAMEREAARLGEAGASSGLKMAWVPPAMMHVTLKYFGEIPPEALDAITSRLRQRCADLAPISLHAKGYGAFPDASSPRVLWVGINGGKPLEALQKSVEADMEDLGFVKEARAYHPHLTVARVAESRVAESRVADAPASGVIEWKSEVDFGTEKVGEIVVFESRSVTNSKNRGGVEYIARARVPFSKTAA